jgi:hypothetical protein
MELKGRRGEVQNPFNGVEGAMVVEVGESEFIEFIWCS